MEINSSSEIFLQKNKFMDFHVDRLLKNCQTSKVYNDLDHSWNTRCIHKFLSFFVRKAPIFLLKTGNFQLKWIFFIQNIGHWLLH